MLKKSSRKKLDHNIKFQMAILFFITILFLNEEKSNYKWIKIAFIHSNPFSNFFSSFKKSSDI